MSGVWVGRCESCDADAPDAGSVRCRVRGGSFLGVGSTLCAGEDGDWRTRAAQLADVGFRCCDDVAP